MALNYGGRNRSDLVYGRDEEPINEWDRKPTGRPGTSLPAEPAVESGGPRSNAITGSIRSAIGSYAKSKAYGPPVERPMGGSGGVDVPQMAPRSGVGVGYPDRNDPESNYTPAVRGQITPSKPAWSPVQYAGSIALLQKQLRDFDADLSAMPRAEQKNLAERRRSMVNAIRGLRDEQMLLNAGDPSRSGAAMFSKPDDAKKRYDSSLELDRKALSEIDRQLGEIRSVTSGEYDDASMRIGRQSLGFPKAGTYEDSFIRERGRSSPQMRSEIGARNSRDIDNEVSLRQRKAELEARIAAKDTPEGLLAFTNDYNSRSDERARAASIRDESNAGAVRRGEIMRTAREAREKDMLDQQELGRQGMRTALAEGQLAETAAKRGVMKQESQRGMIDAEASVEADAAKTALSVKILGMPETDFVEGSAKSLSPIFDVFSGSTATADGRKALGGFETNTLSKIKKVYKVDPEGASRLAANILDHPRFPSPSVDGTYYYNSARIPFLPSAYGLPHKAGVKETANKMQTIYYTLMDIRNGTYAGD